MAYSLDTIKSFLTVDLDNFEVRGARTGVNNAATTGPLFDNGLQFAPSKTILTGTGTFNATDTVTGISFDPPFASLNATILVTGDMVIAGTDTIGVLQVLSPTSIKLQSAAISTDIKAIIFNLGKDREYLIEPDIVINTNRGLAVFLQDSTAVTGFGTTWLTDLTSGDSIQANDYQKYYIIQQVNSNSSLQLTSAYGAADETGYYTAKRWRLGRLNYQYVKNNFSYDKLKARWLYDTTTGGGIVAQPYFAPFVDQIQLQFSPTLNPGSYPDLMDSNLALGKTLTQSTENIMYQYPLPKVPDPEESFSLKIDGISKDRFPDGNMDYILDYWQDPVYKFPPPMDDRKTANVMPLKRVSGVVLSPSDTALGIIQFKDAQGNPVPGVMPGSETLSFDGTDQTAYRDYVLDISTGLGYSSTHATNEPVVKYVAFQQEGLFDTGLSVTLDGTKQRLTMPAAPTDQVLFEPESGRLKPIDKDNPAMGEEYIVDYFTEGDYVTEEAVTVTAGMTWFRTLQTPVEYVSTIVSKNGAILTEGVDYRVSCLTGRVVLFSSLALGDAVIVSYNPLVFHRNGLTYEDKQWYCKVYNSVTPVASLSPLQFTLTNSALSSKTPIISRVYNATRTAQYDITGYLLNGTVLTLQPFPTNTGIPTGLSDLIVIDYKFQNDGVEVVPVQTVIFSMAAGSDYIALVAQDSTSLFPAGTFVRLTNVETAGDYFFQVGSVVFDGEDTVVTMTGTTPVDLLNPTVYISDSPMDFVPVPYAASAIASGKTSVSFPGINRMEDFRIGSMLQVGTDFYSITDSQYDTTTLNTVVSLGVQSYQDYTTASVLSSLQNSDCPLYLEGDTIISPKYDVIDDPAAPVLTLNYNGLVTVNSDSTAFRVDTGDTSYVYDYGSYPNVGLLAVQLTGIGFSVVDYASDWTSSKIVPMKDITVTADSTTVVSAIPALRYQGIDTTRFTVSGGLVTLTDPLVKLDRYSMDYLGRTSLGDTTVGFSGSYFTYLSAKSKVEASFKFDNLDQFYIQAISQRNFLSNVTQPRMKQEALQQSGNVGQGGDIAGDEATGNSSGGITGDEYRRMDTEIESRVFKNIFDFFNGRVQAYADEMYAAFGWRICNNDGLLNPTDESCGAKSINRMFPWADYTSFPVYPIAPLAGQAIPYAPMSPTKPPAGPLAKAQFSQSSPTVTCTTTSNYPTYWLKQLRAGDYIRPYDSTKNYLIAAITNNTQLILASNFAETSANKPFIMISNFPLYDDDGYMGPKIKGTVSGDFGISDGDVFNVTVDGVPQSYTFQAYTGLLTPLNLIYPLNGLSGSDVAKILTTNLPNVSVTYEWVQDLDSAYGYKSVLVLRVKDSKNKVVLGTGAAVGKLGFPSYPDPTATVYGNMNNTDSDPEYWHTLQEDNDLITEGPALNTIKSFPNKLNRITMPNQALAVTVHNLATDEVTQIGVEIPRITSEMTALSTILLEPLMSGYNQAVISYNNDSTFLGQCPAAQSYDTALGTNYEGHITPSSWILNLTAGSQIIHGKDATGMGVPTTGVTPIIGENTFFIIEDSTNDKRFLNNTVTSIDGLFHPPTVTFSDGYPAIGTWTGWDPSWDPSLEYSTYPPKINFFFNDSSAQFVLDSTESSPEFSYSSNSSSMTIYWYSNTYSKVYSYSTYTTITSLKSALNTLAGITTSGSSPVYDGLSPNIITSTALTPMPGSASINKNALLMFTMAEDSTKSYTYSVTPSAVNLDDGILISSFPFATYTTIYSLRTQIDALPGIAVTPVPIYDGLTSTVLATVGTTPVGPSAPLYDQILTLFTLTADGVYNIAYNIDKTGINLSWDGGSNSFLYSTYATVGAMKSAINATIPGLLAVGPSYCDASGVGFKPVASMTAIPPDAPVYPALRNCTVNYYTIDDGNLTTRQNFSKSGLAGSRACNVDARITFLNDRSSQIIQNITAEGHFGTTGNLYAWADNRFNRSNGCYARLKQIEKQMEMNRSSLSVSRRFF